MSRHSASGSSQPKVEPRPVQTPGHKPRRKRVVLNDSRNPVTVVRTITELEEQTSIGEVLVRNLLRAQFKTSMWLAALTLAPLAPCRWPAICPRRSPRPPCSVSGCRGCSSESYPLPCCSAWGTGTTGWPSGTRRTS
jgi:hypothetical protein